MPARGRFLLLVLAALATALGSHWLITQAAQSSFAPLVQGVFLVQHAGVHAALALWFASTLRPGHQPLISLLAQRMHGHLTPAMAHYTRQVTLAWVLYFAAMVAVSLGLYFGGQLRAWSLLINAITPVATLAMFVGEYALRCWRHPEFERVGFTAALRAWRLYQADRQSRT